MRKIFLNVQSNQFITRTFNIAIPDDSFIHITSGSRRLSLQHFLVSKAWSSISLADGLFSGLYLSIPCKRFRADKQSSSVILQDLWTVFIKSVKKFFCREKNKNYFIIVLRVKNNWNVKLFVANFWNY